MTEPKKLIEVAMPVKEISAESVRDKSIRHGHISTLHLWWARRPLPVCRAVVFASLVPDPMDEQCPQAFRQAVAKYLAGKEYKPYDDIPHTAAADPMEDNLRNRLLMFIGKFSDDYVANDKAGKNTDAKNLLSEGSLIKWENKNNPKIINIARKLIFIAHNTNKLSNSISSPVLGEVSEGGRGKDLIALESQYEILWNAIVLAENDLYSTSDRHIETEEVKGKEKVLHDAIENYLDQMPKVFDPFAGGGAIPLEAARLGCRTFGNDLNPVAHIIQRGSVEFPQKYGKPITYTREAFLKQYPVFAGKPSSAFVAEPTLNYGIGTTIELSGYQDVLTKHSDIQDSRFVTLKNRLAFDVEYYARQMLAGAEKEIGQFYPEVNGKKPIAYYWARVGTCMNPSCKAKVPLLGSFDLCNKPGKNISLKPVVLNGEIKFEVEYEKSSIEGWVQKKNLICPHCGNITGKNELKQQFVKKEIQEKLIAVIEDGDNGKNYRLPIQIEHSVLELLPETIAPPEKIVEGDSRNLWLTFWGITTWGQMYSIRQLLAMQTFVNQINSLKEEWNNNVEYAEYQKALITYLGIWIDRISARMTSFGLWHSGRETLEYPFGRQAIPMVFDYPESNPTNAGSGSAINQIDWLIRYIISESDYPFSGSFVNASSGEVEQFERKYITTTITDPPYYDAIAYADISDFFYIWLKRTLGDIYPLNFATPQTPKGEECTALKHHHNNNYENAKTHFESKLLQIFTAIEIQTSGIVSIMFAHQSTEAWTTLCHSILGSNMNIYSSWSLDSEYSNSGLKKDKAYLASSVTVACLPSLKKNYASFNMIKKNIEGRVKNEVKQLYAYGFRGADLLTACFGQAVSEFGQYQRVEKADGTPVTVAELLELARDAAFNAIISDINTDEETRFYIGWLNLFGFTETDHDDVMRVTQVGLSVEVNDLHQLHLFEVRGSKESLSGYGVRNQLNKKLGEQPDSLTIDKIHKAMSLFKTGNRTNLVNYLSAINPSADSSFWRVSTALIEVLPSGCDDHVQLSGLLANRESLIKEIQRSKAETPAQGTLEL